MNPTHETVVAITGASRGIGAALARALAPRGVRLSLFARSAPALEALREELLAAGAADVHVVAGDVATPEVARWIEAIDARWGRLDALVNNAGVGVMKPVVELTDDDWRAVLETNLTGPFRAIRSAVPLMVRGGGGHVVNVTSIAGTVAFPGGGAYCASKFGLEGLSDCLMQEVRRQGVKVSIVAPGSVHTRFDSGRGLEPGSAAELAARAWKIAPEEVARTILFLLESPDNMMASRVELRPTLQHKS